MLVLLVIVLTNATPQGRATIRAILFVKQVVPGIAIKPESFARNHRPVEIQRVFFPLSSGSGVGNVYMPGGSGWRRCQL